MKLVEEVSDDVTIVEPHGRIDSTTAKEFGDRLLALASTGRGSLLVDLKSVTYISSAGFHVLLRANKATSERRAKLALCALNSEVKRLFDIGAFTEQFTIYPTQAEG